MATTQRPWQFWLLFPLLLIMTKYSYALESLADADMRDITGQSLFTASYINGTGTVATGTSGVDFYRIGLEAEMELNANIKSLKLGCGGVNDATTPGRCDIEMSNVSFGCISNAAGKCVTNGSTGADGTLPDIAGNQVKMRDFKLTRPFFEFAIKNPGSLATREIMGVRIGAADANGPLSITDMTSFSGYLTAFSNITMQAQNNVAVTCGSNTQPCPGTAQNPGKAWSETWLYEPWAANGQNEWNSQAPANSLGLNDDHVCTLGLCIAFSRTRVSYDGVARTNLDVTLSGNRQTQAGIAGARMSDLVDEVVGTLSLDAPTGVAWASGLLIPLVSGSMKSIMKTQLKVGLGLGSGASDATLNNYVIPYNVSNMHQIDINSNAFGFTLQKENVVYPGFVSGAVATRGWAMYLPNSFTLDVNQPLTVFVNNIGNGQAAAGNIVSLPNAYRNCWGTLTFC